MPNNEFEDIRYPQWVTEIRDRCLKDVVIEALIARRAAMDDGAGNHPACVAVLASADATLDQIQCGRRKGRTAYRKAAMAVKKYDTALCRSRSG